jgi:hypothetical protein
MASNPSFRFPPKKKTVTNLMRQILMLCQTNIQEGMVTCGNFRLSEMLVCYDDPPQIMEKPMPKFPLY